MNVLTGCGQTTSVSSDTNPTSATNEINSESSEASTDSTDKSIVIEYFEEIATLPKPDSLCDTTYSGKATTSANTNIKYKYKSDNISISELIDSYSNAIQDYGFTTTEKPESIAIVENDIIVAELSEEDAQMVVLIYSEENRVSATTTELSIGTLLTCDDYEVTVKNIDFSYDVMPSNTSSTYMSYPADSGKVYIDVVTELKNTMKRDIRIGELFVASAIYDEQYPYSGFTIVDTGNSFNWVNSYPAATPLETVTVHSIVECPEEVATSDKPVVVSLTIGKNVYEYKLK